MPEQGKGQAGSNPAHDHQRLARIAERAYHLWEKRGRKHGNDLRDWFEAERLEAELAIWQEQ